MFASSAYNVLLHLFLFRLFIEAAVRCLWFDLAVTMHGRRASPQTQLGRLSTREETL
jgi:hypothetical protein